MSKKKKKKRKNLRDERFRSCVSEDPTLKIQQFSLFWDSEVKSFPTCKQPPFLLPSEQHNTTMALQRAKAFCNTCNLTIPILMGPMAGACPPSLASAVSSAGGMGSCGAAPLPPSSIDKWVVDFQSKTSSEGKMMLNLWVPDPDPERDEGIEGPLREFLGGWGPTVEKEAAREAWPQDFEAQCETILAAQPSAISSIMGLYPPHIVQKAKEKNIPWFATVISVSDAKAAVEAGCSAIVAQGVEAGGHCGVFDPTPGKGEAGGVGLLSLIPAIVDAVPGVPVIATGGITDGRGMAAALLLGASAVQVGTGLLRSPEAGINPVWAEAIGRAQPEDTVGTRAYTGRLARGLRNDYIVAAQGEGAPKIAPYPIQRGLVKGLKGEADREGDIGRMQAWAGQSARLAKARPAGEIVEEMWEEARALLM